MALLDRTTIFNEVQQHLLAQNEKSLIPGGPGGLTCAYRGKNGTKCAIGCLIKDEFYNLKLERVSIYATAVRRALERSLKHKLDCFDIEFLNALQGVHDLHEVLDWPEALAFVKRTYVD
jgi:hypothetical protein